MLRHLWSAPAFRLGMALAPALGTAAGLLASALVALLLTGCASFSPDAGMGAVSGIAATELTKDALKVDSEEAAGAGRARVRRLLASTLPVDAAGANCPLHNRGAP